MMTGLIQLTGKEFKSAMHFLNAAYSKKWDNQLTSIYYDILGIYELNTVQDAVREWVATSEFFPRVADITKLIKDKVITFEQVMRDLKRVIQVTVGESWNKSQIHSVSYQILNELGGKATIGDMSEKVLEKKVRFKYKYVVNEQLLGIGPGPDKNIGPRKGETRLLGELLKKEH